MRRLLAAFLLAFSLAACTTISKVEGEQALNQKMTVQVPAAWNKVTGPWTSEPYALWTQEGLPLDHLRLWAGLPSGKTLITKPTNWFRSPGEKDPRYPTFTAGLPPDRLVSVFESLYAREGSVQVTKVEPTEFAGRPGVRFEFTVARRFDDVVLRGVGWAAEHQGELYAATFAAPRLGFYDRLLPLAEAVVRSARIRG